MQYFSAWCSSLVQHSIMQNSMLKVARASEAIYSHLLTKVGPRNQAVRECRAEE